MPEVLDKDTLSMSPDGLAINRLDTANGLVHVADLEWPLFAPEGTDKFISYVAEVGDTITESPRETSTKDSPLQLYRNDFQQAAVPNLESELYVPRAGPVKSVVKIVEWRKGLNRPDYPGKEAFDTGVAVSEDVYEEIVRNAAYFANQVDNRTQRKKAGKMSVRRRLILVANRRFTP